MSFYDIAMCPIELLFLKKMRKNLIPQAKGNVLEIGFGTGANVDLYRREKIDDLYGVDIQLSEQVKKKFENNVILIETGGESLPFNDESFDTVVTTIALCSVGDLDQVIQEIKRVLKVNGEYIFLEHVLPENKFMAKAFNRFNKIWSKHMGGCNINRETVKELKEHGFMIKEIHKKNAKVFIYGKAIKQE